MRTLVFVGLFLASAGGWALELEDDWGNPVVLADPAQRIVALSPHIVENLFAVGAGDQLVGVVEHSDFPPAARDLPRIGRFDSFDREAMLAAEPDLVIAWGSGNGAAIVRQLREWGIPVYVSEPGNLRDIARTLEDFGRLAGRPEKGEAAARAFEESLESLGLDAGDGEPVRVFYQLWHKPMQTVNGEHVISQVIEHCGGRNIFADAAPLAPTVNIESVIARDPQVIVASGEGGEPPPWLDSWRQWPGMSAVDRGRLHHIHPDLLQRHTPRILQGARQLCELLAEPGERP